MATTKFYHDTRAVKKGQPAPLKISITRNGETALLSLNVKILPSEWDKKTEKIIKHPNRIFLNNYIARKKLEVDTIVLKLYESGEIFGMRAIDLKNHIVSELFRKENDDESENLFAARFENFMKLKSGRTGEIYEQTLLRMREFDDNLDCLSFEDITKNWLVRFDNFLSINSPSKNARNIHLRNIRAVFNDAIDDEITTFYPFRKFKIVGVETAKRSLSVEQLRVLFNYNVEAYMQKYLDVFKLMFFLIGINTVDLCNLKRIESDGRINYHRAKTGKLYSVKVEPEAAKIIEKYKGEMYLLDILDRYDDYTNYAKKLNENLKRIGKVERVGRGGKKVFTPLFPDLSTYWARHSWATIAAELDVPKETIAAALGHSIGNPITSIYINFNQNKIDEANRAVIDYVLYNNRRRIF